MENLSLKEDNIIKDNEIFLELKKEPNYTAISTSNCMVLRAINDKFDEW